MSKVASSPPSHKRNTDRTIGETPQSHLIGPHWVALGGVWWILCQEEASAQPIKFGAAVHGPLQELEAVDLALSLPAAPG